MLAAFSSLCTRSRWSEMGNLATFEFDIIETKEGPFGFVEGRSRIHKTATRSARRFTCLLLPRYIGAMLQAVGSALWKKLACWPLASLMVPFAELRGLMAPSQGEHWRVRKEALRWMTTYTSKVVTKLDEPSRLLLGHHSTKKKPLGGMLSSIRADGTRSGWMMTVEKKPGEMEKRRRWMNMANL